ncbi:MAG: hypothetical protein ABIH82_02585 [Candidatus Woesearchaeota archaeon]|nr:hypothetical protein [Nanoarchaeota archaeon]MBU1623062.1 hypothetical protein [Nanoarchaeota archaeon]MBU1974753.1 hypothetical protein [Nanoarchaeota archaeon]
MKKRLSLYLFTCIFIVFFLIGCSSIDEGDNSTTEISAEEQADQEAEYAEAVLELTENTIEKNDTSALNKRYSYLERKIERINSGEEEFNMAQFTRIKIELDYLTIEEYEQIKLTDLTNKFMQAYQDAEEKVIEEDYSGLSLSDRYYSIERDLEKISTGDEVLKVSQYLQIEKGINDLEVDGYPVQSKIDLLRSGLLTIVINELQSAIVEYEIPEEEFTEEIEEEIKDVVDEVVEVIEQKGPKIVIVKLIDGGFGTATTTTGDFGTSAISINVGDTVKWNNVRQGRYQIALILGNRECRDIKSNLFNAGESYNYTFKEAGICWVSDGIYTTQAMKITVS